MGVVVGLAGLYGEACLLSGGVQLIWDGDCNGGWKLGML